MSKEVPYNAAFNRAEHIFCSNCGHKLWEEGSFCTECGYAIGYDQLQSIVIPTQQYPVPTQQYPVRKKYGTRVAGAILLSLGSSLAFFAVYLYFLSWGMLYVVPIVMGVIGGVCIVLGIVLIFTPLKKVIN